MVASFTMKPYVPSFLVVIESLKFRIAGVVTVMLAPSTGLPAESTTFPLARPWVPACAAMAGSRIVSAARIRKVFFISVLQRQVVATGASAEFPGILDPQRSGARFRGAARQGVEDLRDERIPPHGHNMEAAGDPGNRTRELPRDLQTLCPFVLGSSLIGSAHAFDDGLRHGDAGNLVGEEERLFERPQRNQADQHGDRPGFRVPEERLESADVIDRLRLRESGSRF